MPVIYSYDESKNQVNAKATNMLTVNEINEYVKALSLNPDIKEDFIEVFDLSEVEDFNFKYSTGKTIARHYSGLNTTKCCAATIHYSPGDVHYGISHILSVLLAGVKNIIITRNENELLLEMNRVRLGIN